MLPNEVRPPGGQPRGAVDEAPGDGLSAPSLPIIVDIPGQTSFLTIDIDHFRARIIQDALTVATAQYWIHRAYQFQQAAPRFGEFHGNATRDELNEAWTRCHATSQACLSHADLLRGDYPEPISDEVTSVLKEVA